VKDRLLPLRHIPDAIERLEDYAAAGKQAFLSEPMRKDVIARNLEVIGEAVARLPDDLRAKTPNFSWRDPVNMRNWLIHGYDVIDLDVVWDTVTTDLPQMRAIVQALLAEGD